MESSSSLRTLVSGSWEGRTVHTLCPPQITKQQDASPPRRTQGCRTSRPAAWPTPVMMRPSSPEAGFHLESGLRGLTARSGDSTGGHASGRGCFRCRSRGCITRARSSPRTLASHIWWRGDGAWPCPGREGADTPCPAATPSVWTRGYGGRYRP